MSELLMLPAPVGGGSPESGSAGLPAHGDAPEPLERLEARTCELAGHLTAATCQFLLLIADFDERGGWADREMASCAAWLSRKCQIAPGTAREQVRVARSLATCKAHDAAITPTTINPPHSGERLNLSLAIWIAFANARTQADRVAT